MMVYGRAHPSICDSSCNPGRPFDPTWAPPSPLAASRPIARSLQSWLATFRGASPRRCPTPASPSAATETLPHFAFLLRLFETAEEGSGALAISIDSFSIFLAEDEDEVRSEEDS